ncbi:ankyrin repeat domain-containing protein 30B, partial [Daubentonia madagascariensis]
PVSLLKIKDAIHSCQRLTELKSNHCEQLTGKMKKIENTVSALQKELSETKEIKSQLEHQKVDWEREVCRLKFTLEQEKEKRRNAAFGYEKMREKLRKTKEQYRNEVEMKRQLEQTLRTQEVELGSVKNNLNEISHGCEKDLLYENQMLHDEIARLRMEIDEIKTQNQAKENKYLKDIEMLKEKNEESLTKTISQYSEHLSVLMAENSMLTSILKNEKQNKERLETEVESYILRLAAAKSDCDQSQASKREVELAFQRARDEWSGAQESMNSYANILFQKLSESEIKFSRLEVQLYHTKDALKQKTLALESLQRDLSQTQGQKKEIEQMYKNERCKVNNYIVEKESVEERLSLLQSKTVLLQQQLNHAQKKADDKEKTIVNMQTQFLAVVKELQAESEQQTLLLEERNKTLVNECNHLKEKQYQYEKEKAEKEVVVRQLQKEVADTLQKLSRSEASR